jgi:hypothetical protein
MAPSSIAGAKAREHLYTTALLRAGAHPAETSRAAADSVKTCQLPALNEGFSGDGEGRPRAGLMQHLGVHAGLDGAGAGSVL